MPRAANVSTSSGSPRASGRILLGVAGWSYPDWAGIVYPARRGRDFHEATFLAEYFDTIEINTSFYQPLRPAIAEQWLGRVARNPRFTFTAKLWQKFTHETGTTRDDELAVREGFAPLAAAGKLAALLLQFPHSFHRTPENIEVLERRLDQFADFPQVVEVRHDSWNHPEFFARLRERQAGFCNIDQPKVGRTLGPSEHATSGIGYVRLHGRRSDTWFSDDPTLPRHERYNYLYQENELAGWATRIRAVARRARTVFVIANNHFEGKAAVNALQLMHMLTGAAVRVPEMLRRRYPQLDAIADSPMAEPTLFPNPPR